MTQHLSRRATLAGLLVAAAQPAQAGGANPPRFESASRQFTLVRPPRALASLRLRTLDGRMVEVALREKVTLINFWATWCPACVRELPILERLHIAGAKEGVQVAAVSVDRDGRDKVARYLQKLKVRRLPIYLDAEGDVAFADRQNPRSAPFGLYGMPISYILDREARIVGYLPGEADWLSPEAKRLLDYYR